jgi:triosephosphate isomerase
VKTTSVKSPKVKKDDNTLKTSVLVSQLSDVVQNHTHNFLNNSVVAVEPLLAASSILVIICSG